MSFDTLIDKYEEHGLTIEIHADYDAESPRDWSNVGTLYLDHDHGGEADLPVHSRAEFQSCVGRSRPLEFAGRYIEACGGVAFPVQYQEHSYGMISAGRSGELRGCDDWANGLYWATAEKVTSEFLASGNDDYATVQTARNGAREAMAQEIRTYDLWLQGGFTGFIVKNRAGEILDSCWGFDDPEYCLTEARAAAESHAANYRRPMRRNRVGVLA